jgi:hypothetical protein
MQVHFGIRTGSIHISNREYEYVNRLGTSFFAALIAHEVTELDLWRAKAAELIKQGKIKSLGTVKTAYNPKWSNGIRKWIRDNCNEEGTGEAQKLDREYHRRGLEKELNMLAAIFFEQPDRVISSQEDFAKIFDEIKGFRNGKYLPILFGEEALYAYDRRLQAENELLSRFVFGTDSTSLGLRKFLYSYFSHLREKEADTFLNVILARIALRYVRDSDGGVAADLANAVTQEDLNSTISRRLTTLKSAVNDLKGIDAYSRRDIISWLKDVEEGLEPFEGQYDSSLTRLIDEVKVLVDRKYNVAGWVDTYFDPKDTVGSAGSGSYEANELVSFQAEGDIVDAVDLLAVSFAESGVWDGIAAPSATQNDEKGVVIFADDVMDSSAVFDLAKLAGLIGKEGKLLNKVVLYARDERKAGIIEKVIKENNSGAEVQIITEAELKERYGDKIYKMSLVESVLRYALNSQTGIFTKPDQILGVVRGALTKDEDPDEIKEELRRGSLKVPIVAFEDGLPGNVYSLVQAVGKLVEMRAANLGDRVLFCMLPPITRISEALQKDYEIYIYLLRKLEAAA